MDISIILLTKYPTSEWILDGNDYSALTWISETKKPTKKELEDLWPDVQKEIEEQEIAKQEAKESANSKLLALGLTEAEIEALKG